jgi:hypothetical protein
LHITNVGGLGKAEIAMHSGESTLDNALVGRPVRNFIRAVGYQFGYPTILKIGFLIVGRVAGGSLTPRPSQNRA